MFISLFLVGPLSSGTSVAVSYINIGHLTLGLSVSVVNCAGFSQLPQLGSVIMGYFLVLMVSL